MPTSLVQTDLLLRPGETCWHVVGKDVRLAGHAETVTKYEVFLAVGIVRLFESLLEVEELDSHPIFPSTTALTKLMASRFASAVPRFLFVNCETRVSRPDALLFLNAITEEFEPTADVCSNR